MLCTVARGSGVRGSVAVGARGNVGLGFKWGSGSGGSVTVLSSEVLCGLIWCMVNPVPTTDDAVRLRMVHWYTFLHDYDSDGNRVCTSLRKRIPIMEGIHSDGLQLPWKEEPPDGQEEMVLAFFGNVVLALMKDQTAETHPLQTNSFGEVQWLHTNRIWDLPEVDS